MSSLGRYYDGVTAQVFEVGAKPGIGELLIYRPGDFSIVARWPLGDIVLLGDSMHEAQPTLLLKGSEARLVVGDPEMRRQIVQAAPALAGLTAAPPAAGRRVAGWGASFVALIGLLWLAAFAVGIAWQHRWPDHAAPWNRRIFNFYFHFFAPIVVLFAYTVVPADATTLTGLAAVIAAAARAARGS